MAREYNRSLKRRYGVDPDAPDPLEVHGAPDAALDRPRDPPAPQLVLTPLVTPFGGGLVLRGEF